MHNNDLYGSDEDEAGKAFDDVEMVDVEGELDLGCSKTENAPKKQFNFGNKTKTTQVADINTKIQ